MIGWPRLLLLHSAEDRASATISVLGAHAARMSNSQVGLIAAIRCCNHKGLLRGLSRHWISHLRSRGIVSHLLRSLRCNAAQIAEALITGRTRRPLSNCLRPIELQQYFLA